MARVKTGKTELYALVPDRDDRARYAKLSSELLAILFANELDSDSTINNAMAKTGKLLGVSRVAILLDEKNGRYLRNTHEWVNHETAPMLPTRPLHDYEHDIPSLKSYLTTRGVMGCQVREMPADLRNVLGKQSVESILFAPLYRRDAWVGVACLASCGVERMWSESDGYVLRNMADVVLLAHERRELYLMQKKLDAIRGILSHETQYQYSGEPESPYEKPVSLLESERRIITETLVLYNGNKLRAAKHLGLTWPALDRRCKKLGIEVKRKM